MDRTSAAEAENPLDGQTEAAVAVLRSVLSHDLLAVSRFGSAETSGLRPDSDVDLLGVTTRRLRTDEADAIVAGLLPISGRDSRPSGWRPLEITLLAHDDIHPWRHPPRQELQYGEWWHAELLAGERPWPVENPDLGIVIAMAREHGRPIVGPAPVEVLPVVPPAEIRRAMLDALPDLLADLADDTRNVLLTLARMWATAETGTFLSKDDAADWARHRLTGPDRALLGRARDLYRSGGWGTWEDKEAVARLATRLETEIRGAAA